jgi:energy-converting hydrogenase Eha subunit E
MDSKAFAAIILTFNTTMGFLIFLTGEQIVSNLASNPSPSNQPIVSWFNLWKVMIVPYNYVYPSGTPIPVSIIARTYFPIYLFIFMVVVNIVFSLILLRKSNREDTKEKEKQ